MAARIGELEIAPARERPELLAPPVLAAVTTLGCLAEAGVVEIDPDMADTAAFCERYRIGLDESVNCVVVAARREGTTRLAACAVLATTRADVNGVVRRRLDARKASFAPLEVTVAQSGMEYGGISPVGLPPEWALLIDSEAAACARVVVGSGRRTSKLVLAGSALASLPGADVVTGLGRP